MDRIALRAVRRSANARTTAAAPAADEQGLFELRCECDRKDCEHIVRVPVYVYRRILEARNQYVLHRGHHASPRYRTIVASGYVRIEEQI